jgi:hypothetical protein
MEELVALLGMVDQSERLHQPVTGLAPVPGTDVHVLGVETKGTMVPVTAIGERQDRPSAMLAYEPGILLFSAHALTSLNG